MISRFKTCVQIVICAELLTQENKKRVIYKWGTNGVNELLIILFPLFLAMMMMMYQRTGLTYE